MKAKSVLLFLMLVSSSLVYSQISLDVKGKHKKTGKEYSFLYAMRSPGSSEAMLTARIGDALGSVGVSWSELKNIELLPENAAQFWQAEEMKAGIYAVLLRKGYQYAQRRALEEEMAGFLSKVEENGQFYIDSYLESRLYALLRKVYSVRPADGRPGVLSIRIISDIMPDAWVGPDGTLVLSTAMLTVVNSEDELMALMAQEVAHFVLDHHIDNYNSLVATYGQADLAQTIKYSREQEFQADQCAVGLLKLLGKDPLALSSVLKKVRSYGETMGNYHIVSGTGLFPYAAMREATIGLAGTFFSGDYEKMIAPVLTHNAYKAYNLSQYLLCQNLLDRNIVSGQATGNDYVLMSEALLRLYDTPEKNEEALMMVREAVSLGGPSVAAAYKQEVLVLLRMGLNEEAGKALDRCASALEQEFNRYSAMPGDWSQTLSYLSTEISWVGRMRRR